MLNGVNVLGTFAVPGVRGVTAGTAFTQLVPPFPNAPGLPPLTYALVGGQPNWLRPGSVTHVTRLDYTTGAAGHQIGLLRPYNFTTTTAPAASGAGTLVLAADPGLYSANYKFPVGGGLTAPAGVPDSGLAAGDYLAVQLTDGSWFYSKVTSWNAGTLTVTLTTSLPAVTGGGVATGAVVFFFALHTTSNVPDRLDPMTGQVNPVWDTTPVTTGVSRESFLGPACGLVPTPFPGAPLLFWSNNLTAAGVLGLISGIYASP